MDELFHYYEPSFLNNTCELLSDVKQPSFSSLDDSISSEQNVTPPTKEESFSDSEAVRNMLTSTPHRNSAQRRSVSLIDVSKIDEFSNRPFSNMMSSWETMGSQSSVGKSRDSGYIHSGSLLSVNSAKILDMKQGSEQVNSVLDEYNKLKKELEFSEVLINSLQESNNQLRMKCAAANNRIFELRLKCAHQCDCCSKPSSRSVVGHNVSAESTSANSNDSSCSDNRSRSSSPELRSHSFLESPGSAVFSPNAKAEEILLENVEDENVSHENVLEPSDKYLTKLLTEGSTLEYQNRFHRNHNSQESSFERNLKSQVKLKMELASDVSSSTDEELDRKILHQIVLDNKNNVNEKLNVLECDNGNNPSLQEKCDNSDLQNCSPPVKFNRCFHKENLSSFSRPFKEQKLDYNSSSIKTMLDNTNESEVNLTKEEPIFVANEKNGKILVGSFRVWGDSSIKVTPVNKFLSQPSSSDETRKVSPSIEKVNLANQMSNSLTYDNALKKSSNIMLSATPPSTRCKRPVSAYSFPINADISHSRRTTFPGQYKKMHHSKPSTQAVSQDSLHHSSKYDNVIISVKSKSESYQYKISQYRCAPAAPLLNIYKALESPSSLLKICSPERNNGLTESSSMANDVNSCNNNLSSHNVSVTQSPSKSICPDLVLEKWNDLKSKLNGLSLGSFISSDSNHKAKEDKKSQGGHTTSADNSCLTSMNPAASLSSLPLDLSSFKDNNDLSESQSMEECLAKANDYAKQISLGLARLPERLEHIRNIGRTET